MSEVNEGLLPPIIRELRRRQRALGPSQRELAKRIGTAQGHLSWVLAGRVSPTLDLLTRLADELGYELVAVPRPERSGPT